MMQLFADSCADNCRCPAREEYIRKAGHSHFIALTRGECGSVDGWIRASSSDMGGPNAIVASAVSDAAWCCARALRHVV